MADTMAPRGPDSAGAWSQGRVGLGHRRLKIIDLSEAGAQPMVDSELGLAVCWNGCIYTYEELRRELTGHGYRFFSASDTEVLLKAYHHWGDRFVDHLLGMFAFAIVERDSGRVLLGRDRLGIKPLYLTEDSHRIRFASSLPALLAGGGVDTRIDPVALHHYLTFHSVVPPPRTILRGVSEVPPASLVAIEPDGRRTTTTYWEPDFTRRADRAGWSERDWEDAVLASLRLAVERRLVADVPVGCLLSGGVDSSLIVGLLAEVGQHDLATFSIGFESVGGVGTVVAAARHHGSRGMTAVDPDESHPEAITLGLHDASPQHMVDAMADDVVLEMGWGRLIFGQTFADPEKLAGVLRQEGPGRRDICIYAREPMFWSPEHLPNCSSTPATPTG
jgi:asparagine synthase (glutamine-hydrolysing)